MIGRENDQRIVGLPGLIQSVEHAADLRIQLLGVGVVVRAADAHILFGRARPRSRFAAMQSGLVGESIVEAFGHAGSRADRNGPDTSSAACRHRAAPPSAPPDATAGCPSRSGPSSRWRNRRCRPRASPLPDPRDSPTWRRARCRASGTIACVVCFELHALPLHLIGIVIQFRDGARIAAEHVGHFVEAEIQRRPHPAAVPFADVALPVSGVAQPLRIEHDVRIQIAMHRRRRVDLVINAVVPVISAGERHGARRDSRRPKACTSARTACRPRPGDSDSACGSRSVRQWSPTAAGPTDMQNVRPLPACGVAADTAAGVMRNSLRLIILPSS